MAAGVLGRARARAATTHRYLKRQPFLPPPGQPWQELSPPWALPQRPLHSTSDPLTTTKAMVFEQLPPSGQLTQT
jgi:hypothetical protein